MRRHTLARWSLAAADRSQPRKRSRNRAPTDARGAWMLGLGAQADEEDER